MARHCRKLVVLSCIAIGTAATWNLVLLKEAAEKTGAACLDGTAPGYYITQGTGDGAKKWYIHHEGGGWCESLEECYGRALTTLGSSSTYPSEMHVDGGYYSTDPNVNPAFYNWNKAYLKYCDGASFSGMNSTVQPYRNLTLHFRGKAVLRAMQQDLLRQGLRDASDVVVSGCSAGGLSTYLHLDQWASMLKQSCSAHPKVVGMPDSGWFSDYEGPPHYHSGMMWVFNQQNSTSGVNDKCIAAHQQTGDTWKCIFAEHTARHIQTPIFPLQSTYDSWSVANDLGSKDTKEINAYGSRLAKLLEQNVLSQPQNGVFLDSCLHHCGGWETYTVDKKTQGLAFKEWYEKGSAGLANHGYFTQNHSYPCDSCCKKPHEPGQAEMAGLLV